MKNTLKIVLLIIGFLLVGYGIYILVVPQVSLESGPLNVEDREDNSQFYAMIGLGILSLIGGFAFKKR